MRPPLRRTGETALSEVIPCPPVGEVGPPQFLGTSVDSRSLPLSLHHDSINDTPMLGCYHTHDPIYSPHTPLLSDHLSHHHAQRYPPHPGLASTWRRGLSTRPPPLPAIPNFSRIVTPPVLHAWERALEHHPDSQFRDYLTNGLRHGFRVGFNHALVLSSAQAKMHSALLNPSPVQEYLAKECIANRVLGPIPPTAASSIHVNRFGVIPKAASTGEMASDT